MIDIQEYLAEAGHSPFAKWFNGLSREAAAKVTKALTRVEMGNLSNAKALKGGLHEYKIDFGPGYRIYFGKDGDKLVILLGGGTKKRQQDDIKTALELWQDYKSRKRKL